MRSFRTNAKSQGLISTLTGEATLDDAIFVEEKTGLHLLAIPQRESMSTFRNPADILSSQRFKTLVDELRSRYDFVAVDAPPVLAAPDARVISPLADALVFVVRWKATPRAAVDESMKQLHRINAPIIGLCMNAIDERKARRFANQHYGFYPGEYRHGYL
jgi:Mrp family chromosome partitioning ATPase